MSTFALSVSMAAQRWLSRFTTSPGVTVCTLAGVLGTGSLRVVESREQPESIKGSTVATRQLAILCPATLCPAFTVHPPASWLACRRQRCAGVLPVWLKKSFCPERWRRPPQSRGNRFSPVPWPRAAILLLDWRQAPVAAPDEGTCCKGYRASGRSRRFRRASRRPAEDRKSP